MLDFVPDEVERSEAAAAELGSGDAEPSALPLPGPSGGGSRSVRRSISGRAFAMEVRISSMPNGPANRSMSTYTPANDRTYASP